MAKKQAINTKFVEKVLTEGNGYPEKGFFTEKEDLQKFYKHLSNEQLAEWLEVEGLEYKPNESPSINRMRMAMAVLYYHFPKEPTAGKKKSKYSDYTNEMLMDMAIQNDVVFEVCDDERILRMRAIMALRAAKVIE